MVKIFRNIRQKLAAENLPDRPASTRRRRGKQAGKVMVYLYCTIGEIFLIVIGILIAFQLNSLL